MIDINLLLVKVELSLSSIFSRCGCVLCQEEQRQGSTQAMAEASLLRGWPGGSPCLSAALPGRGTHTQPPGPQPKPLQPNTQPGEQRLFHFPLPSTPPLIAKEVAQEHKKII